jgi:amino acid transporter
MKYFQKNKSALIPTLLIVIFTWLTYQKIMPGNQNIMIICTIVYGFLAFLLYFLISRKEKMLTESEEMKDKEGKIIFFKKDE